MGYNEPRRYFTLSSSSHAPSVAASGPTGTATTAFPTEPMASEGNQQQHAGPNLGGGHNHQPTNTAQWQQSADQMRLLQLQHGAQSNNGTASAANANLAASGMNLFGGQALNLTAHQSNHNNGGNSGLQAAQQQQLAGLLNDAAGNNGGAAGLNQHSLNQLVAGFNQHNSQQLQQAQANQGGQQAVQQQQQQQLGLHGQAGTTVDLGQLMASIQAQQQAQQRTVVQAALARAFPGGAGPAAGGNGGLAGGLGGFHGSFNGGGLVSGGGQGLMQQQQLLLSQLQQQGVTSGGGFELLGGGQGQVQQQQQQQRSNEQLFAQLGQKTTGLTGREGAGLKAEGA